MSVTHYGTLCEKCGELLTVCKCKLPACSHVIKRIIDPDFKYRCVKCGIYMDRIDGVLQQKTTKKESAA